MQINISVGLEKPATVLIEKISEAVGGVFAPIQKVRMAKAEAEASMIKALADIAIDELQKRAINRFIAEETIKQTNMESITQKAIPLLKPHAEPEKIDNDWLANFFDKARIVSNSDMQMLWAKILAEEANRAGRFSRKTINLLADLDKKDAELFTQLCGFGWTVGSYVPLIFDAHNKIYNDNGVNFSSLLQLENLGLVSFDGVNGYQHMGLPKQIPTIYYGQILILTFPNAGNNNIRVGSVVLTAAGNELVPYCGAKPVEGFFEYVKGQWSAFITPPAG